MNIEFFNDDEYISFSVFDTDFKVHRKTCLTYRLNKHSKYWNLINKNKPVDNFLRIQIRNKNKSPRMIKVHKLIYKAFNPDYEVFDNDFNNTVVHIDGDHFNNHISNLKKIKKRNVETSVMCHESKYVLNGKIYHFGCFIKPEHSRKITLMCRKAIFNNLDDKEEDEMENLHTTLINRESIVEEIVRKYT